MYGGKVDESAQTLRDPQWGKISDKILSHSSVTAFDTRRHTREYAYSVSSVLRMGLRGECVNASNRKSARHFFPSKMHMICRKCILTVDS
jgi:hypothetical protein